MNFLRCLSLIFASFLLCSSRHDQGGWSQARYQRSIDKEAGDHLDHVASVLFDHFKREPFDRLVIGGPSEILPDFEHRLHRYMATRVAGHISLDVENVALGDVQAKAEAVIRTKRRERERELLDRLVQAIGSGGKAAAGLQDVLNTANETRIECLLVDQAFSAPGYIDTRTGILSASNDTGSSLKPTDNVADALIGRVIESDGEVLIIRDYDDLQSYQGIGALLRF